MLALTMFVACETDRLTISPPPPLQSISFYRLDTDLSACKSLESYSKLNTTYQKNVPDLYAFYTTSCIRVGYPSDSSIAYNLSLFSNDKYIQEINAAIRKKFRSFPQKESILQAFGYLKHYFPNGKMPKSVIGYNSAFTNSVLSSPTAIGFGLERYLGEEDKVIQALSTQVFFDYVKAKMDASFLVRDAVFSWLNSNYFNEENDSKPLIEQAITLGKMYYITEACMPETSEAILLRYSEKEYQWAEENEASFWKYLVEQNALFLRDQKIGMNIFNEGPFTAGLPVGEASSPRMGHFLGWKIVRSFMNEHEEITLSQLVKLDFKTILKSYKIEP